MQEGEALGKFTLISWNSQGKDSSDPVKMGNKWSNLRNWITGSIGAPLVLSLQECGRPEDFNNLRVIQPNCSAGTVRISSRTYVFAIFFDAPTKDGRTSLAVITKQQNVVPNQTHIVGPLSRKLRPVIGVKLTNGIWVYSHHGPAKNSTAARGVAMTYLKDIDQVRGKEPWICAGDYNCEPNQMRKDSRWKEAWTLSSCPSTKKTQKNGGLIDYIVSKGIDGSKVKWSEDPPGKGDFGDLADHYIQTFYITTS